MEQAAALPWTRAQGETARRLAWAGLLLLALVVVMLTLLSAIAGYPALRVPCLETAELCQSLDRLTPDKIARLAQSGLTPGFHAGFLTVQMVVERLSGWLLAALILWRRPRVPLALLAVLMLITTANTAHFDTLGTLWPAFWWPAQVVNMVSQMAWFLTFCLFPDGRFLPHWLRWVALVYCVLTLFVHLTPSWPVSPMAWPIGARVTVIFALYALVLTGMLIRYRRHATLVEREQIKWVAFGFGCSALILIVAVLWIFAIDPPFSPLYYGQRLLFTLSVLCVPVALAIAILRHRLFAINLVLNRTLVYGGLTGGVVALYAGTVSALGLLFQTRDNLVVSLIAAGLVAVLFQPLRARLQRGVNRLVYGRRDEPYAVLTQLSRQLAAALPSAAVLPAVVDSIREALRLPWAAVVLQSAEGASEVEAASGTAPGKVEYAFPLRYQGELLGELQVAPRPGEATLSSVDRRLLADLAQQAGSAVHAARLTVALQRSREALVSAREEERRRLRRDLHDGLGPALATITMQADGARALLRAEPAEAEALLAELTEQAQTTMQEVRRLIHALRPPALDDLGLAGALDALVRGVNRPGLSVTLESPTGRVRLPAAVEVAAYRIVQEALTNVVKHARAHTCRVVLKQAGSLEICVEDDGLGLGVDAGEDAAQTPGVGLHSMRERAEELGGRFALTSSPGAGTRIEAVLPLEGANGVDTHPDC